MPDQDFNLGSGFGEAIGNYNDYQNGRIGRAAKEQSDAQNTSVVHNVTDGTVQVNMPADVFKEKAEAAAKYDQISAIYMKQVQELEAQRAQIKAHPFANTLAQIAGSMAANDVNPITRGLGQAAQRLNPTDAELQAREQVPLRGALETENSKQVLAREQRLESFEQGKLQLEQRSIELREKNEADRRAIDRQKNDLFEQRTEAMERIASSREGSAERRAAEHDAVLLKAASMRIDAQLEAIDRRASVAESKSEAKKLEVPKAVDEKLTNLSAAEKSLDNVDKIIEKYGKYMGAVAGRTVAPVAGYFQKEVAQAETNLRLEVAQAIKATGAGARGFGPQERGFFEALATGMKRSPAENKGTVEAWRQYIQQNRGALSDVYPGLAQPKYRKAFGKDADALLGEDKGDKGDPLGIR